MMRKRTQRRRTNQRRTRRRRHYTTRRHMRAGMFRSASRHASRIGRDFGKELIKDIADRTIKSALKEEKGKTVSRLSSGKLKRVKSRLGDASLIPTDLSSQFESLSISSPRS